MKRQLRGIRIALFWGLLATYLIGAMIPATALWFDPGEVEFSDAIAGGRPPALRFSRTIHRPTVIRYSVVVREVIPGGHSGLVACEALGGPFTYQPVSGPLIGKDLSWWAPGDPRCSHLPPGTYLTETVWTVVAPLGDLLPERLRWLEWLIPAKRVHRTSEPFTILPRKGAD